MKYTGEKVIYRGERNILVNHEKQIVKKGTGEEITMLPATGGIGVNLFYAVGAFLIIGGLFLAVMKGLGGK